MLRLGEARCQLAVARPHRAAMEQESALLACQHQWQVLWRQGQWQATLTASHQQSGVGRLSALAQSQLAPSPSPLSSQQPFQLVLYQLVLSQLGACPLTPCQQQGVQALSPRVSPCLCRQAGTQACPCQTALLGLQQVAQAVEETAAEWEVLRHRWAALVAVVASHCQANQEAGGSWPCWRLSLREWVHQDVLPWVWMEQGRRGRWEGVGQAQLTADRAGRQADSWGRRRRLEGQA